MDDPVFAQAFLLKEILLQLVELRTMFARWQQPYAQAMEAYRVAAVEYREAIERISGR